MSAIIRAENLSKLYQIGAREEGYSTIRETIVRVATTPVNLLRGNVRRGESGLIWALQDVSFTVDPGEVVGIIGRNGAGKSTLLKILSRITKPTTGEVDLYGRVGSLLEVGTGFHPELTGRENIYLNGAILGMKRTEIDRKFDEIVAFAEVEKFLDTPVKRYSSGMYVRLAFAVAAHLEPEILIVDEVLAVGDAVFQKKCLGKMDEVAKQGRTVLFVSHNMAAVKALCSRAMLLDRGQLTCDGKVDHVVDVYFSDRSEIARTGIIPGDAARLFGTSEAKFRSVSIADLSGSTTTQLYLGQPCRITVMFDVFSEIPAAVLEVSIAAMDGTHVVYSGSDDNTSSPIQLLPGRYSVTVEMDGVLLPRQYSIILGLHHYSNGTTVDWIERALDFTVLNVAKNGKDSYRWSPVRGFVRPSTRWHAPELLPSNLPIDTEAIEPATDGVEK